MSWDQSQCWPAVTHVNDDYVTVSCLTWGIWSHSLQYWLIELRRLTTDCTNTRLSPSTVPSSVISSSMSWLTCLKHSLTQGWRSVNTAELIVDLFHFSVSMHCTRPVLSWSPVCWTYTTETRQHHPVTTESCLTCHGGVSYAETGGHSVVSTHRLHPGHHARDDVTHSHQLSWSHVTQTWVTGNRIVLLHRKPYHTCWSRPQTDQFTKSLH